MFQFSEHTKRAMISLFKLSFGKLKAIVFLPIIVALVYSVKLKANWEKKSLDFTNDGPGVIVILAILISLLILFYWDYKFYQRQKEEESKKSLEANSMYFKLLKNPNISDELKKEIIKK